MQSRSNAGLETQRFGAYASSEHTPVQSIRRFRDPSVQSIRRFKDPAVQSTHRFRDSSVQSIRQFRGPSVQKPIDSLHRFLSYAPLKTKIIQNS